MIGIAQIPLFTRIVAPNYELGLSATLITVPAQNSAVWSLRSVDISQYMGASARLVIRYLSGSSYRGDIQFDDFNVGGNTFDPEVGTNSFERNNTTSAPSDYASVGWTALLKATTSGYFNRDASGTGSGSTGLTSGHTGIYYYYAETSSSGYPYKYFWLRSPIVTITADTLSFWSAQYGSSMGGFEAYLDIIS